MWMIAGSIRGGIISGKVEIREVRRGMPRGIISRRCVEARPMNARRRRTGRKVRRDHGSDLKNSRKRKKGGGRERGRMAAEGARKTS